jgi:Dual specificity phosphatase, catalytic domain
MTTSTNFNKTKEKTMTINPHHYPAALFSEILPNLFQGGTDDSDVIHIAHTNYQRRSDLPFDSIVTMYAWAKPADWNVQELRYGIPDNLISDIDLDRLRKAVDFAHQQWKSGDRVLIRCQAGLNRSGLVTALVLIKDGYSADEAINLIRAQRGEDALCNYRFEQWLLTSAASFINPPTSLTA